MRRQADLGYSKKIAAFDLASAQLVSVPAYTDHCAVHATSNKHQLE